METILEQQRRLHEERERLSDVIINEYIAPKANIKDQINSDHRIKLMQDKYFKSTQELKDLYEDKDGMRSDELKAMHGPRAFGQFYAKLKSIKDFYKTHPSEIAIPMAIEFQNILKVFDNPIENDVNFTDEEGKGRYLDLNQAFDMYLNIKNIQIIDYVTYLTNFDKFFDIPKDLKKNEYKKYLEFLFNYFSEYVKKVYPLLDVQQELKNVETNFDIEWKRGTFPGWPKSNVDEKQMLYDMGIDLNAFSSPEELASLGLDRLKDALKALSLKCGGTLDERARRLFNVKLTSLKSTASSTLANTSINTFALNKERDHEIACLEAKLYYFVELFGEQKMATKDNVQRKQAMGIAEYLEDQENALSDNEESNDLDEYLMGAQDDIPYNPKNLPLDWDGKPIPYWLYKLHGLNINYNCEICGNHVYRGPKAFQLHFSEWRHAHGMRCLGIPNTVLFNNITLIEDAINLWEKLKLQKGNDRWKPDIEEEFEDNDGNVISRKTYEDLKRQDLL